MNDERRVLMNDSDLHERIQQIQDETGLDELTAAKIASAQLEQEQRPQRPMARIGPNDLLPLRPPADVPLSPATSTTTTDAPCAWCDGAGWYKEAVPYGHPNFGKLLPCQCKLAATAAREQGRHDQLLSQLKGELGTLAHCRLTNYVIGDEAPLQAALSAAERYRYTGWLYLWGSCGTGKSHLAAALAHEAVRRGLHASYASVPALLRFIKQGFKDDTSDDRMAALQQVGFLVLDDIGAEYHTRVGDFNATALFEIVNYRDLRDLPTVFTSNIRCDELESRISSRIYGRAQRIRMVGSDYRKRLRS